jgi:hypothetical protein
MKDCRMSKKQSAKTIKNVKRSPHVPGQALGYSLQGTQFVSLLLQAPRDAKVSLEVFDDIGVETADNKRKAIQTKSTADGNPVSDRAVDLWKTFYNWKIAAETGELNPDKTIFEIYVSKKVNGTIVDSFSNAETSEHAKIAYIKARTELWGTPPEYKKKESVAESISSFLMHFFDADETMACKIIRAFKLVTGSGSPQTDLKELFSKYLVPDDLIDDVHAFALGWVKYKTDLALEQRKPAIIDVYEFRTIIQSFIRKHDSKTILRSFAKEPQPEEIEAETLRKYVRQLEIINSSDGHKIRAITDYLKASIDRTQWSTKGLVFDTSFDEFEDTLVRAWENLKTRTFLGNENKTEVEKGQLLYSECSLHRANLQNMETPAHFVPGSFNALADVEAVGWHPDFQNQLKNIDKKAEEF